MNEKILSLGEKCLRLSQNVFSFYFIQCVKWYLPDAQIVLA